MPVINFVLAGSFGLYALLEKMVPMPPAAGVTPEGIVLALLALGFLIWLELTGRGKMTSHGLAHVLWLVSAGPVTAVPLLLFSAAAWRIPLAVLGDVVNAGANSPAVLHHQDGDGERDDQLDHRLRRPLGSLQHGGRDPLRRARPAVEAPEMATATAPTTSAPMIGGTRLPSDAQALSSRNASTIGAATATSSPSARTRSVPNRRKRAGDHPHDDRHADGVDHSADPARQTQDEHQQTRAEERADHLREAEMAEGRTDEHRAGDGPEEREGLPVDPAGQDREDSIEEEDAEHPRRGLLLRQPTPVPTARITATTAKISPISPFAA